MESILAITIGVIVFILFVIFIVWRLTYGAMIRTAFFSFFKQLFDGDPEVDANAPIYPSQEVPISDLMREQAQIQKGGVATTPSNDGQPNAGQLPQASIQATSSAVKANYNPPYTQNPATIMDEPIAPEQADKPIASPVQPLVEDITFKRDDPIIDEQYIDPTTPSADTLDAHVPKSDKSEFGVRYADHSPGRVLRDKRSSRNSS